MYWNAATVYIVQRLNLLTSYIDPPPVSAEKKVGKAPQSGRKVLVLQCHPLKDSFSNALSGAVVRGLQSAGNEVKLKRLYCYDNPSECYCRASFPAPLSDMERTDYHRPDITAQRETSIGLASIKSSSKEVIEAVEDLRWCDAIVFVYPTWWFNLPAMLKGYFDRVFLPGVAFRLPKGSSSGVRETGLLPGLTHIKKIGGVSTYGAPHQIVFAAGDNGRRFLSRGCRALCAPDCQLMWHGLYQMDETTLSQREQFLKAVEAAYKEF